MVSEEPLVEVADRASRRRAIIVTVFALAFLALSLLAPPVFRAGDPIVQRMNARMWAVSAIFLLGILATGGSLLSPKRLRALVNDDVAHTNRRTAIGAGYWIAMAVAMGLYIVPTFRDFSAREAVFLIATPSIGVALLAFVYLERRAHRDA